MKKHVPTFDEFVNESETNLNEISRAEKIAGNVANKIANKLVDLDLIPVRKKNMDFIKMLSDISKDENADDMDIANKIANKLVDLDLIPVRKKSIDFINTIANTISNAKMESQETDHFENLDEATTSWKAMMKLIPYSSGPWSIVAVENGKVIDQSFNIAVRDVIPAEYEDMREKHSRATIHIEDAGGSVLWTSPKKYLNEAKSMPAFIEKAAKEFAYSMPNHSIPDDGDYYSDEKILKAISKYSNVLKKALKYYGFEKDVLELIQKITRGE